MDNHGPRPADPDTIKALGREHGLTAVGITTAEHFAGTQRDLEERRDLGLHDTMQFTYRNPPRSTTPTRILADASSIIVGARAYPSGFLADEIDPARRGRIASYAWRDHYRDLRSALEAIAELLRDLGWTARVVADDNALVDRAAAVRAGIGWFGKNSNVLLPGSGSFFVLGSVVTDAPLIPDEPLTQDCGTCRRCLDGCPTGAIVSPGVIDAGRCLAWLLQREGMFPAEYRKALGNRIYGCDDCQDVCPPSRLNPTHRVTLSNRPARTDDAVATVDLVTLLDAGDEDILDRHGRWYIPKREVAYIRRNALIALANASADTQPGTPDAETKRVVADMLQHESAMLRGHAVWAAHRIGAPGLTELVANDTDPLVIAELAIAGQF